MRNPLRAVTSGLGRLTHRRRPKDFPESPRGQEAVTLLPLWAAWGSPPRFWDAVQRRLGELAWPYAAFAVRTDGPDTPYPSRVRDMLEGLLTHPLVQRLIFITPQEAVDLYSDWLRGRS